MNGVTYLLALREALTTYNLPDPYGVVLDGRMFQDVIGFAEKLAGPCGDEGISELMFNGFLVVKK